MKKHHVILFILLFIGIADFTDLSGWLGYQTYRLYVRVPIYAGLLVALWFLPRRRITVKLKYKSDFYLWSIILSLLFLVSVFLGGVLNGFGKSPYDLTLKGIMLNVLMEIFPIAATVFLRFHIIQSSNKKYRFPTAVVMTVLIALTSFTFSQYVRDESLEASVTFLSSFVVPEVAVQGIVTYLTVMAGPLVGLIYYLIITVPFYILDVIPDLAWLTALVVKTVLPVFGLLILHERYTSKQKRIKQREKSQDSAFGLMITSILSVMVVWFAVGVFPVFPNVVLTGSMMPGIMPGDIVLIEKAVYDEVALGDVLYFEKDDIHIVHRVIDIDKDKWHFQTKGDNNPSPDADWVESGQVRGIQVGRIPYVGRILLWLRGI